MKILLYGLNYAPEITGIGKYTGEFGGWLSGNEHDVKAVTAQPYYPDWSIANGCKNRFNKEEIDGVEVLRCPLYVPGRPTTITRLIHLVSFVFSSSFRLLFLLRWRPQIVVNVVPAVFTSFPAWLYCRITGAKLVIHIQDFESDAMFSLGMAKPTLLSKVWMKLESFIFNRADMVTTISGAMIDNAIRKGVEREKVALFPNWSEVSRFREVSGINEYKESLGFSNEGRLVLYSGNIGHKQGLGLMVQTAQMAAQQSMDVEFVICGEGAAKLELVDMVKQLALKNVRFLPLQPYEKLPQLLAMADVHLVIQNPGVADAVLPSKLTNIFAVGGNAVITSKDDTEIGRIIKENPGIAVQVKPEDPDELLIGIKVALKQNNINHVAVDYAENKLAKEAVLQNIEYKLLNLIKVEGVAK